MTGKRKKREKIRTRLAAVPRLTIFSIVLFICVCFIFGYKRYRESLFLEGTPPQITVETDMIEVSVNDDESVLMKGVRAWDEQDGDISDNVIVENVSAFVDNLTRTITYVVYDSDDHIARAVRKLKYVDYESPMFSLSAPLEFPTGSTSILDDLSAADCIDGDITGTIKIVPLDNFNLTKAGIYPVTFRISNSAGDAESITANVVVYDPETPRGPQFRLKDYLVYVPIGGGFDPYQYLDTVMIGGRNYQIVEGRGNFNSSERKPDEKIVVGRDTIMAESNVNTAESGSYEVVFSITVDAGNQETVTGSRRMIVVVR